MHSWIFPLDPDCPEVREYEERLYGDPMSEGAPCDEIMEAFANRHRPACERCEEYGAANVEVA